MQKMTSDPAHKFDWRSRFTPNPENNCLILQVVLSLAVVVIGIKLGKLLFAFYAGDDLRTALRSIYSSWFLRIVAAVVLGFAIVAVCSPRRKRLAGASPILFLVVAKMLQALWHRNPATTYVWLQDAGRDFILTVRQVFPAVYMDLWFLFGFAIVVYLAVALTPARYGRSLRVVLAVFTGLLLCVSSLDLAHYSETGAAGTGQLLGYLFVNAANLWPMLRSEMGVFTISALLMPLVVGLVTALLVRRWYARRRPRPALNLAKAFPAVLLLLPLVGLVHPPLYWHAFDRFHENLYLGLRDLIPWREAGELEAIKRASRLPAISDTSKAVLRARAGQTDPPRNVIIIMLESARAGSTSMYDPALGTTPFLAEFAKRGALVPEMYAVMPRTSAAWIAVLHGIWPPPEDAIMTWAQKGQLQFRSLPRLLATRGYSSAFFTTGRLTFGYDGALIKNMGFDSVYDGDTLPNQGFERPTFWGFEDRMMLQPSLDWVKKQRDEHKPFLLAMMTNIGHYDYKFPSTWPAKSFGNFDSQYNNYLNCLSYIDSMLKDFIAGLEDLDVLKSSIVIILGDHGESFGEHGPRQHTYYVYDETLKIPAVLYADGLIQPGTSVPGLRQQVDIVPTVFDALGLSVDNATLPGTSLFQPIPADRPLYFSATLDSNSMGLRREQLKFIYNFERAPTEVYSLDQDPTERHDIARATPPAVINAAEMDLLVWRERVNRLYRKDLKLP